jgi:hypothetical protein
MSFSPNTAGFFEPIVTSDSVPTTYDAIYVGVGGTVILENGDGLAVTFVGVPTGSIMPVRGYKVLATGTTATNLVGLRD